MLVLSYKRMVGFCLLRSDGWQLEIYMLLIYVAFTCKLNWKLLNWLAVLQLFPPTVSIFLLLNVHFKDD